MEEERRRQMKDMMMMASSPTQIQVIFLIILSDSYGNENLSPMSSWDNNHSIVNFGHYQENEMKCFPP